MSKAIISALFDEVNESVVEQLKEVPPKVFHRELVKYRKANPGSFNYPTIIGINTFTHSECIPDILDYLERCRTELTGTQFDEVLPSFGFNYDVSVMGGAVWQPHLLLNGGVAIRNHHRVVAFDGPAIGVIQASSKDVAAAIHSIVAMRDDEELWVDSIHPNESDYVWLKGCPEEPSKYGQTLVFIHYNTRDLVAQEPLLGDVVLAAMDQSRTGTAVLRIFEDRTYVKTCYRAGDAYDVLLEEFSESFDESPADQDDVDNLCSASCVGPEYAAVGSAVTERVKCRMAEEFRVRHPQLSRLLAGNFESYASIIARKTMDFTPMFSGLGDVPPSYYRQEPTLWHAKDRFESHNIVSVKIGLGEAITQPSKVVSEFKALLKKILSSFGMPATTAIKVGSPTRYSAAIYADQLKDLADPAQAKEWFKDIKGELAELLSDKPADLPADELEDWLRETFNEVVVVIAFTAPSEKCVPEYLDEVGKDLSANINSLDIESLKYGYRQGFSCGDLDTGNTADFEIDEPQEDPDDDDQDDEGDENSDSDDSEAQVAPGATLQGPAAKGINAAAAWPFPTKS